MNSRFLLVVGDKFAPFTAGKDALTISQLNGLLDESSNILPSHSQLVLVPGQGLSDSDVEKLIHRIQDPKVSSKFNFDLWYKLPKRASMLQSHKHHPENTLISKPTKIDEDLYRLHLMVDDDCELMRDHQSGQHVQGMVLLEAARQSLIAVTEVFFIFDETINYSFILNNIEVEFSNFAFPLAAVLNYDIKQKDIRNKRRLSFTVDVDIEQCGAKTAACSMSFAAYEAKRISARENSMANRTMDGYISNLGSIYNSDYDLQAEIAKSA